MHTDAGTDYIFRIIHVRATAKRGGYELGIRPIQARWFKSYAFHFASLRARKVVGDFNDPGVGSFTKNSEITRFNSF